MLTLLRPTIAAFLLAAVSPAFADSPDTVSDAQSKIILEYWHKQCDGSQYPNCTPAGVDLAKNTVKVLDKDLAKRKADIDELQNQTLADQGKPHNDVALFLRYCKADAAPKYQVDIALYKLRGDHAWEVAKTVTEKMWQTCNGYEKSPAVQAAIKLFQKVKRVEVRFQPQPFDGYVDYDFDDATGTLIVKALDKTPLPNQSTIDKTWKTFLHNH